MTTLRKVGCHDATQNVVGHVDVLTTTTSFVVRRSPCWALCQSHALSKLEARISMGFRNLQFANLADRAAYARSVF